MNMKEEKTQLEFPKTILEKVSFDPILFEKSLIKLLYLSYKDSSELKGGRKFILEKFKTVILKSS